MNRTEKNKQTSKTCFIVNDYFQSNGKSKKAIVEEYIVREASKLL